MLSEVEYDTGMAALVQVGTIEARIIVKVMERGPDAFENPKQLYQTILNASDEVASVLAISDHLLNDVTFWVQLERQVELSKFKALIGSTHLVEN